MNGTILGKNEQDWASESRRGLVYRSYSAVTRLPAASLSHVRTILATHLLVEWEPWCVPAFLASGTAHRVVLLYTPAPLYSRVLSQNSWHACKVTSNLLTFRSIFTCLAVGSATLVGVASTCLNPASISGKT